MTHLPGPIIPRRRLAAELRRLRTESGLSLEQVARKLMISTSKLSRLENAQGSPQGRDVRDLIILYGMEETPLAEQLMRWVKASRRQGWWNDYSFETTGSATQIDVHLAYESDAAVARVYTIPFIPALLQTENYARALYRSLEPWRSNNDIEQLVRLRMRRQQVIRDRPSDQPALQLKAVAHETCIRQFVGSPQIMREQLQSLVQSSKLPNVDLRILPFSAGPVFSSTCMWAQFEFGDSFDRDVVHIETHAGFRYIESIDQVASYRRHFNVLQEKALDPHETRAFVSATISPP